MIINVNPKRQLVLYSSNIDRFVACYDALDPDIYEVPLVVTNFLTTFFTGLILFLIVKEKSKTN